MTRADSCYRLVEDGIELTVRLTPRSSKEAVEGIALTADGHAHLQVKVRAVPEKGKANDALTRLVAKRLKVARSSVSVASGATARLKTLRISGDPDRLCRMLDLLIRQM